MKKKLTSLLSVVLVLSFLIMYPVKAMGVQTYAWPGRPGGTGTGSEEWLQGEYGQTNGPYKEISTKKGPVSDLTSDSSLEIVSKAIISAGIAKVHPEFETVVTVAGLLAALKSNQYEGAYYVMKSSVSGRSMKIVTKTYLNSNYTGYVKTYTTYIAW